MRAVPLRIRGFVAVTLGATVVAALVTGAGQAQADIKPAAGTPATVSADALPTVQINGVVWSSATVGNTVYATGSFTKARPAGVAVGGAGEVTRNNALAFDIRTGKLLAWNPSLNAQGRRIVASPSGDEIYIGGDFTEVGGVVRKRVAGFKTATGALDTAFAPTVSGPGKALAVSADTVFVGGGFASASGQTRTRLAAFKRSNGAVLAWAPAADDIVEALAVTADGKRVIVGGRFATLNGATQRGIGAVDSVTGTSVAWSSKPLPDIPPVALPNQNGKIDQWTSWVTDLKIDNGVVYGSANGQGVHMFDGRFAADAGTGALVWLDNCYGATYGVQVVGKVLYSVSHAHDCDSLGAFGETVPETFHRALAETTYATGRDKAAPGAFSHVSFQPTPSLLTWFPTISAGSYTGQIQGAWTVTGNDRYLVLGGEFPKVNGVSQQGLVRFATVPTAPGKVGPVKTAGLTPSVNPFLGRNVTVRFKPTSDMDDENLTYAVYRDAGTTPVWTRTVSSLFWKTASTSFTDTNVPTGRHTYTVKVTDSQGNSVTGAASAAANVLF